MFKTFITTLLPLMAAFLAATIIFTLPILGWQNLDKDYEDLATLLATTMMMVGWITFFYFRKVHPKSFPIWLKMLFIATSLSATVLGYLTWSQTNWFWSGVVISTFSFFLFIILLAES